MQTKAWQETQPKTTLCEVLPGATATRSVSTSASAQRGTSSGGILHRSACRRVLMGLFGTFHHSRASVPEWELVIGFYTFMLHRMSLQFFFFLVYLVYLLVSLKTFLQFLFHTLGKRFFFFLSFFFSVLILLLFALHCHCWRHQKQILQFVVECSAKNWPVNESNDWCTDDSCQGQMGWCRERWCWHQTAKIGTNLEWKSELLHHKARRKNIIWMWELDNPMEGRLSFQMADSESYQSCGTAWVRRKDMIDHQKPWLLPRSDCVSDTIRCPRKCLFARTDAVGALWSVQPGMTGKCVICVALKKVKVKISSTPKQVK